MTRSTEPSTTNSLAQPAPGDLIEQYVSQHPHKVSVVDAWLPRFGYSVWILADALNAANGDTACVARDYELPEEAVEAVVLYYERHRKAIDAKILLNSLDFNAPV
jgi:hypothetical protein